MPGRLKTAALASALIVASALAAGCDTTSRRARTSVELYWSADFPHAEAAIKPTITKKDENYVLNNCRFGSCALAAGDAEAAQLAFLTAYKLMNSTDVNDSGRTAGAAVVWEGIKVWLGEPFERAMAHYYLGLTFLQKGDYDNARAAFQNSLFKLRAYASKDDLKHYSQAESNFALGYFGLGFCYLRLNRQDLAQQNFALAQKYDPSLATVISQCQQPGINALIFVDSGQGPRRAPKGWYNEESAFGPTPAEVGPINPVQVLVDGRDITGGNQYALTDTLAMAQEQRWQDIDTIRKTKAVVGTGAMAGGTGLAAYGADKHDKNLELAGVGVALFGAALAASSQADVRYWEMLPRTVYIIPAKLSPGQHQIVISDGYSQGNLTLPASAAAPNTDLVLYFRLLK